MNEPFTVEGLYLGLGYVLGWDGTGWYGDTYLLRHVLDDGPQMLTPTGPSVAADPSEPLTVVAVLRKADPGATVDPEQPSLIPADPGWPGLVS